MPKLYVHVLEYYVTIKKNEVELYILKGLQDLMLPKSKLLHVVDCVAACFIRLEVMSI